MVHTRLPASHTASANCAILRWTSIERYVTREHRCEMSFARAAPGTAEYVATNAWRRTRSAHALDPMLRSLPSPEFPLKASFPGGVVKGRWSFAVGSPWWRLRTTSLIISAPAIL